jgi:hypothetical protein
LPANRFFVSETGKIYFLRGTVFLLRMGHIRYFKNPKFYTVRKSKNELVKKMLMIKILTRKKQKYF